MDREELSEMKKRFESLPEIQKGDLRTKLTLSKELSLRTGQKLFGFAQEDSFVCPLCGNREPGIKSIYYLFKSLFECPKCKYQGNLFNFQAQKSGREKANRDDFLTVDAVSLVADDEIKADADISGEEYFSPALYGEWMQTQQHSSSYEKERRNLESFIRYRAKQESYAPFLHDNFV